MSRTELVIDINRELDASEMTRVMTAVRKVTSSILDVDADDVTIVLGDVTPTDEWRRTGTSTTPGR